MVLAVLPMVELLEVAEGVQEPRYMEDFQDHPAAETWQGSDRIQVVSASIFTVPCHQDHGAPYPPYPDSALTSA